METLNGSHLLMDGFLVGFCPFFAFVLISIFSLRNRGVSAAISIMAIALSAVLSGIILFHRLKDPFSAPFNYEIPWITINDFTVPIGLLINNLSASMMFIVSFVAMLIQIYSVSYMENEEETVFSKYFAFMSLFAASMLGLVMSPNFFQIYIFWELVGLSSYLLIGFWYSKKSAADAAKKAFVVTRFGDMGFLLGIILLYLITGSFSFDAIPGLLDKYLGNQALTGHMVAGIVLSKTAVVNWVMFLVFCGAIGKSAMFPLHVWLPDAMEGPTPVSALIHAATMVAAGVFLVAQTLPIFHKAPDTMVAIAYIGGFTAFIAATMGIVQDDIKRVLAYSTISQLGIMIMALGLGGYVAGVFHLFTHAFFKALLFLCAGSVIHAIHSNNIWEMGRLGKYMPTTAATFLIGALALAGVPPLAGFWSKDEIMGVLWQSKHYVMIVLGFGVAFCTAFYMFRVYYVAFCGRERSGHPPHESSPFMTIPLVILAFFAIFLGFIGVPGHSAFAPFIEGKALEGHEAFFLGPLLLSMLMAGLGILTAWLLYGKEPEKSEEMLKTRYRAIYTLLVNKYYMDDFWSFIMQRLVFGAAKVASFIDEKIVDNVVNLAGWATDESGKMLRKEESGLVQQYAAVIVISLAIILMGAGFIEAISSGKVFLQIPFR
ncbi:MAG: NADH-quinone oxidoreductase subunit L [Candidatus Eremiobacteraeota bacterium]|nr:NADH-quinone oxidoreductase subunit L [Candidatus Eremiobacteraeota bacterium]